MVTALYTATIEKYLDWVGAEIDGKYYAVIGRDGSVLSPPEHINPPLLDWDRNSHFTRFEPGTPEFMALIETKKLSHLTEEDPE